MHLSPSSLQSLKRVFHTGFSAHDITEPLVSCDESASAAETFEFMSRRKLEVVGVRSNGLVAGYIERSSLDQGQCGDYIKPFDDHSVILNTTPLAEVIQGLRRSPRLFVSVFGTVCGIVTKTDLQKPPVRMWLFGMITLIEMRMTRMIDETSVENDWDQFISQGRLEKANELLAERTRMNQCVDLIDCLQFSDKCQIVAKNERLRSMTRMASRRQVEEEGKKLQRLRNNLAHAQDIITSDWESVIELSENLDDLIEGPRRDQQTL